MRLPRTLRDLPPEWAHLCLAVERFMTTDLGVSPQDKHFLVGLSGGADSTALLIIFNCLSTKLGLRLSAAHLDHGIRKESAEDAEFCAKLCQTLGISLRIHKADVPKESQKRGIGLEEAGRMCRYDLFAQEMISRQADWLALGHHADDLAEDMLMRLIRGAGWPELAGMQGVDRERKLVRPLLPFSKKEIVAFLESVGVGWREDASNTDPTFFRNRIRTALLPQIAKENPNFPQSALKLWQLASIDRNFWDSLVEGSLQKKADQISISREELENAHQALRLRIFKRALEELGPGQPLMPNLLRLDRAFQDRQTGKLIQFPGDKTARVTRGGVHFSFMRHKST